MNEKSDEENGFRVADKRRFTSEGDVRGDGEKRSAEEVPREAGEAETRRGDFEAHNAEFPQITFSSFIVSLATQALMQLGELPPPPGVHMEVDRAAAKHSIDILIMLRDKTLGNLDKGEGDLLEEVLHNVQISFVRHSTAKKQYQEGR